MERRREDYRRWANKEGSAFRYDPLINYKVAVDIGAMDVPCTHCGALKWEDETSKSMCCGGGKVRLPPLRDLPELLNSLIIENVNSERSKHFLSNIRPYNAAFVMTSMRAKEERQGGFMPTFRVQGQMYHRIGPLLPNEGAAEQFLQLYFVANEGNQLAMRMSHFRDLRQDLVRELQQMLHAVNPLVRELKTCLDSHLTEDTHQIVIRADRIPQGEHPGRHHAPTAEEIAVLLVGQEHGKRDIVLKRRGGGLQRISETHR